MVQAPTSTLRISISGPDPSQRIQKVLNEGETLRIGRAPHDGWAIPWDLAISREHADLCWEAGTLRIVVLPAARNPIVYRNRMTKELSIFAGDWFQIGSTTFQAAGVANQPHGKSTRIPLGSIRTRNPARSWSRTPIPRKNCRKSPSAILNSRWRSSRSYRG